MTLLSVIMGFYLLLSIELMTAGVYIVWNVVMYFFMELGLQYKEKIRKDGEV